MTPTEYLSQQGGFPQNPAANLLTPKNAALLQLASGLLAQSGPQDRPTSFGQGLGLAMPKAMEAYQGARSQDQARQLQQLQMATATQQFQGAQAATAKKVAWDAAVRKGDWAEANRIDPVATMAYAESGVRVEGDYIINNLQTLGLTGTPSAARTPPATTQPPAQVSSGLPVAGAQAPVTAAYSPPIAGQRDAPYSQTPPPPVAARPVAQPAIDRNAGLPPGVKRMPTEWFPGQAPDGTDVLISRVTGDMKPAPTGWNLKEEWGRRLNPQSGVMETVRTPKGEFKAHQDYQKNVKPIIDETTEIRIKYDKLIGSIAEGTGSGDIAAINSFVRMVDDGVVRAEDMRIQREAVSWWQSIQAAIKKMGTGALLGEENGALRKNMRSAAKVLMRSTMRHQRARVENQKALVEEDNLDWNRVISKYMYNSIVMGGKDPAESVLTDVAHATWWEETKAALHDGREYDRGRAKFILFGGRSEVFDAYGSRGADGAWQAGRLD